MEQYLYATMELVKQNQELKNKAEDAVSLDEHVQRLKARVAVLETELEARVKSATVERSIPEAISQEARYKVLSNQYGALFKENEELRQKVANFEDELAKSPHFEQRYKELQASYDKLKREYDLELTQYHELAAQYDELIRANSAPSNLPSFEQRFMELQNSYNQVSQKYADLIVRHGKLAKQLGVEVNSPTSSSNFIDKTLEPRASSIVTECLTGELKKLAAVKNEDPVHSSIHTY